MTLTRRKFVQSVLASAVSSELAHAAVPGNPDVVIVGAGAAGLAAAKRLLSKRLSVAVLDARPRIGGRAHTDTQIFGVPYDMGCHWLHYAADNPWVEYAKSNGFSAYPSNDSFRWFKGGQEIAPRLSAKSWESFDRFWERVDEAAAQSRDVSVTEYLDPDDPWSMSIASILVQGEWGKELAQISTFADGDAPEEEDWLCREGFGTLVQHFGAGVPVALDTRVKTIHWNSRGVSVDTTAGVIKAPAVIVTASTGVLAAETIKFSPELPAKKRESFHGFPMGVINHIALMYDHDVFAMGANGFAMEQAKDSQSVGFFTNMSDTGLNFAWTGGDLGRQLEQDGREAAVDFGREQVRQLLGESVDKSFVKGWFTRWGKDQFTQGSYASPKPGHAHLRDALRTPVADRIFFAGETCHKVMPSTCAGAYLSGLETAEAVAGTLKGRKAT